MRFFELLNNIHIFIYLFPALAFIVVFGLALGYSHFRSEGDKRRMEEVVRRYPEGLESRNAPFPLAMTVIIIATVVWVFFYILYIGKI
ncbi:MAG: hypothetical protein ACQETG_02890 [Thermodesulfobacteriota bacterium]